MHLQQLLDAIQTEKHATQPLALHRIAGLDEHTREYYGLLLAAVLRVHPSIGRAQSRMFALLLEAMGLPDHQASLFERTQVLSATDLSESRRLITEHGLTQSFLLDICILLRVEGPLSDDDLQLCAELADLLQVDGENLSDLVALALHVLGIKTLQAFPEAFDFGDCAHWLEFIFEEVTDTKLKAGLQPGLWVLKQAIEMDTGWSLKNVTLFFTAGAKLDIDATEDTIVSITNCRLINPVMHFKGQSLAFNIQDSTVEGCYFEHVQLTAFRFDDIKAANVKNTYFATRNARAVHAFRTVLRFERCRFNECGNRHLAGGALAIRTPMITKSFLIFDHKNTEIVLVDCQFIRCTASLGGALRIDRLDYRFTYIKDCLFADCSSTELGMDYAVYVSDIVTSCDRRFIERTQFKRGGFYLGNRRNVLDGDSYDHVFSKQKLVDAKLNANMRYKSEFIDGITSTGNYEIHTNVLHQLPVWAEEF
jgi:hypothetical protein